jgi:hypothetical protein
MKKQLKRVKKGYYAAWRDIMKEYGFPLMTVMCGKMVNGRYTITHRSGARK